MASTKRRTKMIALGRPPRPKARVCQAPGCENHPTLGPQRFVTLRRGRWRKPVLLHVCRGCYECYRRRGTFKRMKRGIPEKTVTRIVSERMRGDRVVKIQARHPEVGIRQVYLILERHGISRLVPAARAG